VRPRRRLRDPACASRAPSPILPLKLDVTSAADIAAAANAASDVALLVNNAGVLASFNILGSTKEQLDQDFATNFWGPLALIKAFVPILEKANGAAIANVLTVVSLASRPVIGGYAASKAAAFSMTQSLRPELKAKKIDVHSIIPGAVDTDMIRAFPIPKANPDVVAKVIVDGIERGEEDIVTDPFARDVFDRWVTNPKGFERYFGTL
jgi:NAD(P)-dependent dehydrogenase (short-subunit alcohol dehydrogenase family)